MSTTTAAKATLMPLVPALYKRILSIFPEQYFRYCFAYGSGVFSQGKASGPNPMIDLIFSVDDSAGFHEQNMLWNPSHYSGLRHLGPSAIALIQEKWPARVYFNTLIPLKEEGIMIKYGVVKNLDLINDLLDWDYLYLAGRLHKPVLQLRTPKGELEMALRQNHYSALHCALLLMPEQFTERQLFTTITALSYSGDFRMVIGENKNKINDIVNNQIESFRSTYRPALKMFEGLFTAPERDSPDELYKHELSAEIRFQHLIHLPKALQLLMAKIWQKENGCVKENDVDDVLEDIAHDLEIADLLAKSIRSRNKRRQSVTTASRSSEKPGILESKTKISSHFLEEIGVDLKLKR